ncbi:MAG: response regulator transcription factor [Acidobacteria bacterium]|nr:response regulator transcription factor [Acidobacteriota bacterium]
MTRIALFCGVPAMTRGLETALRHDSTFELLPPCRSLFSLISQIAEVGPDIILLDYTVEITASVLGDVIRRAPGTRVVLWAERISTEKAMEAMKYGVRGILRKTLPTDLQMKCLQKVRSGDLWFEKALTDHVPAATRLNLTSQETRLLSLLSQGLKNWEIADSLSIPEAGVEDLLQRLYLKLGVNDRFELALFGLKNLAQRSGGRASNAETASELPSAAIGMPFAPTLQ